MLRRSFLKMLGIAPIAPALVATEKATASTYTEITMPVKTVTVPSYPVRMPVKIRLTPQEIEMAEIWGMPPETYARHKLELYEQGKLEMPSTVAEDMQNEIEAAEKLSESLKQIHDEQKQRMVENLTR